MGSLGLTVEMEGGGAVTGGAASRNISPGPV